MIKNGKVLVLGDDMRIFLAIARSLGRAGHHVHAVSQGKPTPAQSSRHVSAIHTVPAYSKDKEQWLVAMTALIARENFDLIIPCSDAHIIALHENQQALTATCLAIPSPDAIDWLFDKELTHELSARLGVKVAPAARLQAEDSVQSLISGFGLPFIIKPRRSFWNDQLDGADKVHVVETQSQLESLLPTFTKRDRWLAEAFFAGAGIGVSVIADEGRVLHAFQHRRLREGWGGSSTYRISEALHQGMLSDCEKICAHMQHTGVCMFEFRFNDATGDWILLESNARFWGSMGLAVAAGADYPRFLFDLMVNGQQTKAPPFKIGLRSRNFLLDGLNILRDLRRTKSLPKCVLAIADFAVQPLRWLAGTEVSDSFVLDDLKPAVREVFSALRG